MGVVWYRFRADARRGWKAWLAVAILMGPGGGILALVAGARRRDGEAPRSTKPFPGSSRAAALGLEPEPAFLPELGEEVATFGRGERLPRVLAALMALVALGRSSTPCD